MTDLIHTPEPAHSITPPAPVRPASIALEDGAGESDREDAFDTEPVWNGQLLHPFSIDRYSVFVSQRVSIGAPSLYQALRDGSAFYPEAIRILWLCAHAPATIAALRHEPESMQAAIEEWAAEHAPIHRAGDAVSVAIRIFNAVHVNRHDTRPGSAPATSSHTAASGN